MKKSKMGMILPTITDPVMAARTDATFSPRINRCILQLDIFAKRHNLSLPFGATNFVHRFTFGHIKNVARETSQGSSWEVIVHAWNANDDSSQLKNHDWSK